MTRHSARASPALRSLNESDPAMAALALWCDHRDTDGGPAAETVGSTIHYGPAFDTLPRHEQIGLCAHHILHAALRHTARMADMAGRLGDRFSREIFNIAADAIVNEALLLADYAIPRPALTLTGLLADVLAIRIPAPEALAEWDVERLYIRLAQDGPSAGSHADRAATHARAKAFAADMQPDAAASGTDPDRAEDAATWRQHLTRAMEAGRIAGRGIGRLGHRIADIPEPQTPWELILRRLVTRAVTDAPRQTHRRPARAWIAAEALAQTSGGPAPAFQPGRMRTTPAPRIVLAIDMSSSVDDARLAQFMAEVAGIARRSTAEIHLLTFDEAVQSQLRLDPARWQAQLAGLTFARGGGTSFVPVIAAALVLCPSVIVVLTDLEGDCGPRPRGVPVIWAVPDALHPPLPPFGQIISLAR